MIVEKFANALRWLINLIHLFASFVALPALALVIAADVTMRYFVNQPILGAVEASQFLLLLVFTLGLNFTTLTQKHIRMDLFFDMMPRWMQLGIEVLSMFCGIILFGALARQSFDDYHFSIMISDNGRTQHSHMAVPVHHADRLFTIMRPIGCYNTSETDACIENCGAPAARCH